MKETRQKSTAVAAERYKPDYETGLTEEQVGRRKLEGAVNDYSAKPTKSYFGIVAENIFTVFNLVCALTIALLVLAKAPFVQFIPMLLTVTNIGSGIANGISAKKKLDKLTLVSADDVKVIRGGKGVTVGQKEIVLDDVLLLEQGQQIPVDCVLLSGFLDANEALLTGESEPVKKQPGDPLFGGSFIVSGSAYARAETVGADTYVAKLTEKAKKYKKTHSEIMRSTNLFLKIISIALAFVAAAVFFVSFFDLGGTWAELGNFFGAAEGSALSYAIQLMCCVIIGVLPVGILFLNTLSLAEGIIRLYKYDTLVQDMNSMEMLARVSVLCLDKTGTITDGNMTVSEVVSLGTDGREITKIISNMLGALKAENSTAAALRVFFGRSFEIKPDAVLPFSSARKLSAATFGDVTYAFGAPGFISGNPDDEVNQRAHAFAEQGLRVIALARAEGRITDGALPEGFTPMAVIALQESVREDAAETIAWFRDNAVAVKVISGDNPVTVSRVAARAGIDNAGNYISLDGLTDEEVACAADKYTVFGRVSPEQKAVLVSALKESGETVGMTGDGVNDILAMRRADCAICVESGSNAAKSVSNLVLLKNNFSAMPRIVETGRRIINNIKDSTVLYVIKTAFFFLCALYCICSAQAFFFTPSNAFTLECFTIGMCSFLLSQQPGKKRADGRFMPDIIRRSLPAALTMFLGILAVSITYFVSPALFAGGANGSLFTEVLIVVLTFSGVMMLFHTCQPVNLFKSGVVVLVLLLCVFVVSVPVAANFLSVGWNGLIDFNGVQMIIICGVTLGEYPVLVGISALTDIMYGASEKTRLLTSRVTYYSDELKDDFVGVRRESKRVDDSFKYERLPVISAIFRATVFRFIIRPAAMLVSRVWYRQRVIGREKLRQARSGYFLYGNHTHALLDAYKVCTLPRPKFAFAAVSPENLSGIPGFETLMLMMGAFPVPTTRSAIKNFIGFIEKKSKKGHPIVIYPEAKIWPFYTKIRPFKPASFNYPVKLGKPSYAMTATYQKRRFSKKPRVTVYIDGPFFPEPDAPPLEQRDRLRNKVYGAMLERAALSDYEYVRYRKRGGGAHPRA